MNTISENANPWRPSTELAVVPEARTLRSIVPEKGAPKAIGSEGNIEDEGFQVFGEDGFTFMDFLDIINPLQHIPIVATLYREMSGDDLDPGSRVIGDTLFMGPVGTVAALANVMIDDATGMDRVGLGKHNECRCKLFHIVNTLYTVIVKYCIINIIATGHRT